MAKKEPNKRSAKKTPSPSGANEGARRGNTGGATPRRPKPGQKRGEKPAAPKAGKKNHSSGWKSEKDLSKTGRTAGSKSQYRVKEGKSWRGKPVVEVRHTMRLNKYISNAGISSRREADNLIAQGLVEVNGKQITEMGYQVKESDKVTYAGERISPDKPVYILLNKPKDFVTTTKNPNDQKSVMMLIRRAGNVRVAPIDKLNKASTGLMLFTNDGRLAKKMTHPVHGVKKLYHIHLDKVLKAPDLRALTTGVEIEEGVTFAAEEAAYVKESKDRKQIGIEIKGGKNGTVRKLFEKLGYHVLKLDRVTYGGLTKKDLPRGKWRFLNERELNFLKMG